MDWQYALTFALIGLAAGWVLRAVVRTLRGTKTGCGTGCKQCTTPDEVPAGRIRLPQL